MHKVGLQDTQIRKDTDFQWLVSTTNIIGNVFKAVNYGKEFNIAAKMKDTESNFSIDFKTPKFFSETRFANHASCVYSSFREDFPALIRVLEENRTEKLQGTSDDRKKAQNRRFIQHNIE